MLLFFPLNLKTCSKESFVHFRDLLITLYLYQGDCKFSICLIWGDYLAILKAFESFNIINLFSEVLFLSDFGFNLGDYIFKNLFVVDFYVLLV